MLVDAIWKKMVIAKQGQPEDRQRPQHGAREPQKHGNQVVGRQRCRKRLPQAHPERRLNALHPVREISAGQQDEREELDGRDKLARGREIAFLARFLQAPRRCVFGFLRSIRHQAKTLLHSQSPACGCLWPAPWSLPVISSMRRPQNAFDQPRPRSHQRFEKSRLQHNRRRKNQHRGGQFHRHRQTDQMKLRLHAAQHGERGVGQQQQRDQRRGEPQPGAENRRCELDQRRRPAPVQRERLGRSTAAGSRPTL